MTRIHRALIVSFAFVAVQGTTTSFAQETMRVAPFQSIELNDGGHVVVRPAATHRVTLLKGNLEYSSVRVTGTGDLVIETCRSKCPKGYQLEIEVFTPNLRSISVANSGRIETRESFPRQAELDVAVSHGGNIDARAIVADRVTASVNQGGGIMTTPRVALFATVVQGGAITYWGDPEVKSSVEHGGIVTRGRP